MENVLLMPSMQLAYGIFATELSEFKAPVLSRLCIGFAPGANGSPSFRKSGVAPVCFPYMTLDVIVRIESVCSDPLYAGVFRKLEMNVSTTLAAMVSTSSSSLPNAGQSPSTSNRVDNPDFSSRIILTFACLMALRESATTLNPAMPNAINRLQSVSMSAKNKAS